MIVMDEDDCMVDIAKFFLTFSQDESCGKCTPCRIGSTRGVEVIQRIRRGERAEENLALLEELCETLELGSLCALGGLTPMPVRSVLRHFANDMHPTREAITS